MAKNVAPLLPSTAELLQQFGDRLRLARQRRRLSAKQVAERAGMSPMTLRGLERGGAGVTMGAYLAVMQVLGMESDLGLLAQADAVGRELQDARLTASGKRQASNTPAALAKPVPAKTKRDAPVPVAVPPIRHVLPGPSAPSWIAQGGFASSDALAALLDAPAPKTPRKGR